MNQVRKYVDLLMKFLTDRMPRKVAISSVVLAVTALLFLILLPLLGGAHTDAVELNQNLKASIEQTSAKLRTAKDDHKYVVDNMQKYEELLRGDRLVPHTRRVAMTQMQKLALDRKLTTLSYNFTALGDSAPGAARNAVKGGYKLRTDRVDLKIGSALDTQVYDFVTDLGENFPGAAVVEQLTLERAPEISGDALNQVSRGQESGLVKGDVVFAWKTAQKQEEEEKGQRRR
jgi:hypothetical protein